MVIVRFVSSVPSHYPASTKVCTIFPEKKSIFQTFDQLQFSIDKLLFLVPDEAMKKQNTKFSTRHTAAGLLVHIDGTAVSAVGYMPQDILGSSILDHFHPEDMPLMKTAYEKLMKNTQVADGRVSTPPYRFLIKNGCYITLETEWTRVFNPWSRKLEFVTGDHCILKGNWFFLFSCRLFFSFLVITIGRNILHQVQNIVIHSR